MLWSIPRKLGTFNFEESPSDANIEKCFDRIDHEAILKKINTSSLDVAILFRTHGDVRHR